EYGCGRRDDVDTHRSEYEIQSTFIRNSYYWDRMSQPKQITLSAITGIPLIQEGDDLAEIIYQAAADCEMVFMDGDVLILAQKIVSKSEGRLVNLTTVIPTAEAVELAAFWINDLNWSK